MTILVSGASIVIDLSVLPRFLSICHANSALGERPLAGRLTDLQVIFRVMTQWDAVAKDA
jgi:hypothetical protein